VQIYEGAVDPQHAADLCDAANRKNAENQPHNPKAYRDFARIFRENAPLAQARHETRKAEREAAGRATRPFLQIEAPCTPFGNAERLVQRHGGHFRFVKTWGKWIAWDGKRWAVDHERLKIGAAAKETIRNLKREAADLEDDGQDDKAKAVMDWARRCETREARASMVELAAAEPGIAIEHTLLDQDPWLLTVQNGTIDLRTGELRPHNPQDLITKLSPVTYDAEALAPIWGRTLTEIMGGDAEMVAYLQRVVGYCLTGSVQEHALFFFHGGGANGKSLVVNTILAILGDYGCKAPMDLLLRTGAQKHETGLASLYGARFAAVTETEEGRSWAEATVKELTGGDRIKARRMREDFWEYQPTHKLCVCSNPEPNVQGTDNGIWRRLRKVPFEQSFPEGRADKKLPEKLAAELSGILAWAVQGCLAWQRQSLSEPERVRAATAKYREEQDTFGQFVRERCHLEASVRITRAELRKAYEHWCEANGEKPLAHKGFSKRVRALSGVVEGSARKPGSPYSEDGWHGLRLQTLGDAEAARPGTFAHPVQHPAS
jgi:putative DNA primase/helicase